MAAADPTLAPAPSSNAWLVGPGTDLLLGCGLASILMLGAHAVAGQQIQALVPGALLVLLFSLPHYGATLLRVYEDRADCRRYAFFSIYASAAIAAMFVVGLQSALIGSLILTLYLTWSPWHYTGQNYGIFLMLLGRRGVSVSRLNKRFIYASFVFCYAVTFFSIHGVERSANYAPVSYDGTIFHLMPLGIPPDFAWAAVLIAGLGYSVTLVTSIVMLLRKGSVAAIGPSLLVAATQALWFSVPVLLKSVGGGPNDLPLQSMYGAYGFLWIAAAHAVQYLWITTYYARSAGGRVQTGPFLAKAAMAGFAIWTLPALLFAPGLLGRLPHESGLALMVAACVNLHHFVLDGAIWKLRDGRLARILLPTAQEGAASPLDQPTAATGRHWLRPLLLGLGALSIVYGGVTLYEEEVGFRAALERNDLSRARQAVERFAWLGRDGPSKHTELGVRYAQLGEMSPAQREFLRSTALHPTFSAWHSLARMHDQAGSWEGALRAYENARELKPDDANVIYRIGVMSLRAGQPERAVAELERAAELAPRDGMIRATLIRARREAGRGEPATPK